MTRTQTVNEDKAALLREEVARGKIDRRDFMRMSALLGLTAVGGRIANRLAGRARKSCSRTPAVTQLEVSSRR